MSFVLLALYLLVIASNLAASPVEFPALLRAATKMMYFVFDNKSSIVVKLSGYD